MVACLDALGARRDPAAPTAYRGVYRRGDRFRARFRLGQYTFSLGTFPNEREAALAVAREYEWWYGPLWWRRFEGDGLDRRRQNPWGAARRGAGWVAVVYEWGQPVVLGDHLHPRRPALDWPHRRRPWVYPTRAAACAAAKQWVRGRHRDRYGVLSRFVLYR